MNLTQLELKNSAIGNVSLDLNCAKLNAVIGAVGNTVLKGKVGEVIITNKSVGNVEAFDLSADILTIEHKGVGNAEVRADKEIYITAKAVGDLFYKGDAVVKEMKVKGLGNVKKQ